MREYNQRQVSLVVEEVEEARLKPNFGLHLLEASVRQSGLSLAVELPVNEVASFSVHAKALSEEDSTFFGLILGVDLLIFTEFVGSMGKLALLFVGAEAEFEVFFAEL